MDQPPKQETTHDVEKQHQQHRPQDLPSCPEKKVSAFKSLGLLDRFLAMWIFLAMVIGILLGNFVPKTEEVLDKGRFVGVSVPIGEFNLVLFFIIIRLLYIFFLLFPTLVSATLASSHQPQDD